MPDYKEMYLEMARKMEKIQRLIIETQQKCEELYIQEPETELTVLYGGKSREEPREE